MRRTTIPLVLIALLVVGAGVSAAAPVLSIATSVIAGGGGHAQAGSFTLDGTIGQAVVGVATGGPYVLCSGYWCNVGGEWRLHLPLVLRNS